MGMPKRSQEQRRGRPAEERRLTRRRAVLLTGPAARQQVQRPGCPAALPRPRPLRVPQLGALNAVSPPAKVSGPALLAQAGHASLAPSPGLLRPVLPRLSAIHIFAAPSCHLCLLFSAARTLNKGNPHPPVLPVIVSPAFLRPSPPFPTPTSLPYPHLLVTVCPCCLFSSSQADFLGLFWPCKV